MSLALTGFLALALCPATQDELPQIQVADIRARCLTRLDGIPGIISVGYVGSGTNYRILIVLRDYTAKLAAREKLGGDKWEGLPVLWSVTSTATVVAPPAAPVDDPKPTDPPPAVSKAPLPAAANGEPDCDIVRSQMGLPAMRRPVGGNSWKSWIPCKVWLRSVVGAGGGHSYLYTKHRPGCGYRDGLASEVYREGFLYPTELRGSDRNWWGQVAQDLQHKFPAPPPPMQPKTTPYRRDVATGQ